jgi:hypothetical protein
MSRHPQLRPQSSCWHPLVLVLVLVLVLLLVLLLLPRDRHRLLPPRPPLQSALPGTNALLPYPAAPAAIPRWHPLEL